jgi:hypothetical protein
VNCESIRPELVAYLQDELGEPRRAEVQAHLGGCRACSAELEDFRSAQQALAGLRLSAPSQGFEQRVRARIAAKVEELRSRGSVRFRTGRERVDAAQEWPGLNTWVSRGRRAGLMLLLAAGVVLPLLALIWFGAVRPYFEDLRRRKEFAQQQFEEQRQGLPFRLRREAPRTNLRATSDGRVAGLELLGKEAVRLVPVWEPGLEVRPDSRIVYVFTPGQWRAFLAQERIRTGTPSYPAWKNMVEAAREVLPEAGTLYLPPQCFRELLGEPGEVAVLTLPDHYEIWDRGDLDEYLRPPMRLAPRPPAGK